MHAINHQQLNEDRRKSWTITIIVHALLLLLALLPFITHLPESQEYLQAITINFDQPIEPIEFEDNSSKQSGAAAAAASAESSESAAPAEERTPREQVTPLATVSQSTPTQMVPVPTREIVTTEANPEIYVPTQKSQKSDQFFEQPLDVVERVEVDRVEAFKDKPNPAMQQQVVWQVQEAPSSSEPGAPTSFDFGNGQGSGTGKGTAQNSSGGGTAPKGDREDGSGYDPFGDGSFPGGTGTGTGNQGNRSGVGNNGTGMRIGAIAGDGLFNRKVIKRAEVAKIAVVEGKVVVNLCVDQLGNVVYAEYDPKYSTIRDKSVLAKAEDCAKRYVWNRDSTAPKEQCGRLTFLFEIEK